MNEQELLESAPERIARHRMAEAVVRVVDTQGQPVAGMPVRVAQTQHAFLFGGNIYRLFLNDTSEAEAQYQQRFTDLFNYATLGFYWRNYEWDPGVTKAVRLRTIAEWCRDHGLTVKGHPLVWHEEYPRWGPVDVAETKACVRKRVMGTIAEFSGLVDRWDVVNEATITENGPNTGVHHWVQQEGALALVRESLLWAQSANPHAVLVYNDCNISPVLETLLTDLVETRTPFDVIGIQSHMHTEEWTFARAWVVCDTYARFGKPLHFTETTILSGAHGWRHGDDSSTPWPSTPEGEAHQADYVTKFYTLLFSHPAVEAITWWDLADSGAWQGAPAGLVREDLSPKPVYERLQQLIKETWWTKMEGKTDDTGAYHFRGFLGQYRIGVGEKQETMEVTREGGSAIVHV